MSKTSKIFSEKIGTNWFQFNQMRGTDAIDAMKLRSPEGGRQKEGVFQGVSAAERNLLLFMYIS